MSEDSHQKLRKLYGFIAEFPSADALVDAVRRVRASGYHKVHAFAPFHVEELADALDLPKSRIPIYMFFGGLAGAAVGLVMQYYAGVVSYPMDIGGRPLNAWPAFIPAALELTILFAVLTGLISLFFTLHLPAVYHPVFNHPDFRRASRDSFFLAIEASDERFDLTQSAAFLGTLGPLSVQEVEK